MMAQDLVDHGENVRGTGAVIRRGISAHSTSPIDRMSFLILIETFNEYMKFCTEIRCQTCDMSTNTGFCQKEKKVYTEFVPEKNYLQR